MRKRIVVFLGLFLIFLLPSAAGAGSLTAREAAELVKERIDVPVDAGEFTSNYSEYDGRGQWEFQWTSKKGTVNATLDAESGDISSYYAWGKAYDAKKGLVPNFRKDQALNVARDFLKKAVPGKYGSLVLVDKVPERPIPFAYDRDYSFYFERVVNGIPCPSMGAEIRVSSATGKVTNCYLNWDYKSAFPSAGRLITAEQAEKTMKKENGFELMYFRPYPEKEGREREMKLVYGVNEPRRSLVDAVTGEFVKNSNFYIFRDMYGLGVGGRSSAQEDARAKELTPVEEKEVAAVADLLTKEEAQEVVFKQFPLPDGFKLDNARLFEDERKERVWHLGWSMDGSGDVSGYMSASVDARTGELLSYSKSVYSPGMENEPKKYSLAEAKKIGEEFLRRLQPQKMSQTRFMDRNDYYEASRTVFYTYARMVNGVPFYEDSISVEVDRVTGEVNSFYIQWGKFSFPKPSPAMNLDEAFQKFSQANPLELAYLNIEVPKYDRPEQKMGLYYYFAGNQPRFVDALNGKIIMDNGEEYVSEKQTEFTDIAGHIYEKDIKFLYDLGVIGDASGKFNPDNQVVKADFIKMLVLANGWQAGEGPELEDVPDAWYIPYYQTAVYHGILSRDDLPKPGEVVLRINAARFMVSAAGLKKAADLEGIYKVPAKDGEAVPEKDAGYAAIALKLGLIKDVSGSFKAESPVTRGEAASMLAAYMHSAGK